MDITEHEEVAPVELRAGDFVDAGEVREVRPISPGFVAVRIAGTADDPDWWQHWPDGSRVKVWR